MESDEQVCVQSSEVSPSSPTNDDQFYIHPKPPDEKNSAEEDGSVDSETFSESHVNGHSEAVSDQGTEKSQTIAEGGVIDSEGNEVSYEEKETEAMTSGVEMQKDNKEDLEAERSQVTSSHIDSKHPSEDVDDDDDDDSSDVRPTTESNVTDAGESVADAEVADAGEVEKKVDETGGSVDEGSVEEESEAGSIASEEEEKQVTCDADSKIGGVRENESEKASSGDVEDGESEKGSIASEAEDEHVDATEAEPVEDVITREKAPTTGDKGNPYYAQELDRAKGEDAEVVMQESASSTGGTGNPHYAAELNKTDQSDVPEERGSESPPATDVIEGIEAQIECNAVEAKNMVDSSKDGPEESEDTPLHAASDAHEEISDGPEDTKQDDNDDTDITDHIDKEEGSQSNQKSITNDEGATGSVVDAEADKDEAMDADEHGDDEGHGGDRGDEAEKMECENDDTRNVGDADVKVREQQDVVPGEKQVDGEEVDDGTSAVGPENASKDDVSVVTQDADTPVAESSDGQLEAMEVEDEAPCEVESETGDSFSTTDSYIRFLLLDMIDRAVGGKGIMADTEGADDESAAMFDEDDDQKNTSNQSISEILSGLDDTIAEKGVHRITTFYDGTDDEDESTEDTKDMKAESTEDTKDLKAESTESTEDTKDMKAESAEDTKDMKAESTEDTKDMKAESTEDTKDMKAESTEDTKDVQAESTEDTKDVKAESTDNTKDMEAKSTEDTRDMKAESTEDTKDMEVESTEDTKDMKAESTEDTKDMKAESTQDTKDRGVRWQVIKELDGLDSKHCAVNVLGYIKTTEGDSKEFICNFCSKSHESQPELFEHVQEAHTLKCYVPECTYQDFSYTAIISHCQKKHAEKVDSPPQPILVRDKSWRPVKNPAEIPIRDYGVTIKENGVPYDAFVCAHCEKAFRNTYYVLRHIRKHHTEQEVIVKVIDYNKPVVDTSDDKSSIFELDEGGDKACLIAPHKKVTTQLISLYSTRLVTVMAKRIPNELKDLSQYYRLLNSGEYRCGSCMFKQDEKKGIEDHVLIHLSVTIFKCPHCNYGTNWRRQGITHLIKYHQGKKCMLICRKPYKSTTKKPKGIFIGALNSKVRKAIPKPQPTFTAIAKKPTPVKVKSADVRTKVKKDKISGVTADLENNVRRKDSPRRSTSKVPVVKKTGKKAVQAKNAIQVPDVASDTFADDDEYIESGDPITVPSQVCEGDVVIEWLPKVNKAWKMDVSPYVKKHGLQSTCAKCGYTSSHCHVGEHVKVQHFGAEYWVCPYCDLNKSRQKELEKHVLEAHPGEELRIYRGKPFKRSRARSPVKAPAKTPVKPPATIPPPEAVVNVGGGNRRGARKSLGRSPSAGARKTPSAAAQVQPKAKPAAVVPKPKAPVESPRLSTRRPGVRGTIATSQAADEIVDAASPRAAARSAAVIKPAAVTPKPVESNRRKRSYDAQLSANLAEPLPKRTRASIGAYAEPSVNDDGSVSLDDERSTRRGTRRTATDTLQSPPAAKATRSSNVSAGSQPNSGGAPKLKTPICSSKNTVAKKRTAAPRPVAPAPRSVAPAPASRSASSSPVIIPDDPPAEKMERIYACPICTRQDKRKEFIISHCQAVHRNVVVDPDTIPEFEYQASETFKIKV